MGDQFETAGLVHLKGLPNLRDLELSDTPVTDAGVAELKRARPQLSICRYFHEAHVDWANMAP
jgi:hypothetical protein